MRFNGGEPLSWSRLERILSGRPGPAPVPVEHTGTPAGLVYAPGDAGAGSSASPQHPASPASAPARSSATPFAELHAVSSYSFLGGASEPEAMVARAAELGMTALALTDRDGFYGAVKFAEAAGAAGLATVFGAELSLDDGPQQRILPVLARGPEG